MKLDEAVNVFTNMLNEFPTDMIRKLVENDVDSLVEVTVPTRYDRVFVSGVPIGLNGKEYKGDEVHGEIMEVTNDKCIIELEDGIIVQCSLDDIEVQRDYPLPIWGEMWQFKGHLVDWSDEEDIIRKMSDLGFRIFRHEEFGYFFGINNEMPSFMDAYWKPLYLAMNMNWHGESEE